MRDPVAGPAVAGPASTEDAGSLARRLVAERRGAGVLPDAGSMAREMVRRSAEGRARAAEQDALMAPPSVLAEAGRRIVTTDPVGRTFAAIPARIETGESRNLRSIREGLSAGRHDTARAWDLLVATMGTRAQQLGIGPQSTREQMIAALPAPELAAAERAEQAPFFANPGRQEEYLSRRAEDLGPQGLEAASELQRREILARDDANARMLAAAEGLGVGSRFAFAGLAPGLTAAMETASLVPGVNEGIAEATEPVAAPGGAIARALGADEGSAGEALGRTVSSLVLPALLAGGARYTRGRFYPEGPNPRIADALRDPALSVSEIPRVVREGGGARKIVGMPEILDLGAIGSGLAGVQAGPEAAALAARLGGDEGARALAEVGGGIAGLVPGVLAEGAGIRAGRRAGAARSAMRARIEERAAAEAARDAARAAAEAEAARWQAALGLADPIGSAAERLPQEAPPPGPDAIRAAMEVDAATTRAAEGLRGEGRTPGEGDIVEWLTPGGRREFGRVLGVGEDGSVLRVAIRGRRTPVGVPVSKATILSRGGRVLEPPAGPDAQAEALPGPAVAEAVGRALPRPEEPVATARPTPEAPPEPIRGAPRAPEAVAPPTTPPPTSRAQAPRTAPVADSGAPAVSAKGSPQVVEGRYKDGTPYFTLSVRGEGVYETRAEAERQIERYALRGGSAPVAPEAPPPVPRLTPTQARAAERKLAPEPATATAAEAAAPPQPVPAPAPAVPPARRVRKPRLSPTQARAAAKAVENLWSNYSPRERADMGTGVEDPRLREMAGTDWADLPSESRDYIQRRAVEVEPNPGGGFRWRAGAEPGATAGEAPPAPREQAQAADAPGQLTLPFSRSIAPSGFAALEAVDWKDPRVRMALKSTFGGGAGYMTALALEREDDSPETVWARRILLAGIGAAAPARRLPGWTALMARAAAVRARSPLRSRTTPEVRERWQARRDEGNAAVIDAIEQGNRQLPAVEMFPDPGDQLTWGEYLGDRAGSEEPFLDLMVRVEASHGTEAASRLLETAEVWRTFSRGKTGEQVDLGVRSPEAAAEYAGGYLKRMRRPVEGDRRWFGLKGGVPKIRDTLTAEDALGFRVSLGPEEVREALRRAGVEDPTLRHHHYLRGDETGTIIKWPMDEQGMADWSRAYDEFRRLEQEASRVPVSASRIEGGGDPSMVVQVGEGSGGGVGKLARPMWDDVSLSVSAPRAIVREVAAGTGVAAPEISTAGRALRVRFASAADRQAFLDGLQELAVERATFNTTPQARAWLRERLKGATVRVGPGSRGGANRIIQEVYEPRSRESMLAEDVLNPAVRAFETARQMGTTIADARLNSDVATGYDSRGAWSIGPPIDGWKPDGTAKKRVGNNIAPFEYVIQDGHRWIVLKDEPSMGSLRNRAVRDDWHDLMLEAQSEGAKARTFFDGLIGQVKQGKILTPVGTLLNFTFNTLPLYLANAAPWSYPRETLRVLKPFLKAAATGDWTGLADYSRKTGFRMEGAKIRDTGSLELLESVEAATRRADSPAFERGRTLGHVLQQGVLAGGPGLKGALRGAGIASSAGASLQGLIGILNGEEWDELLARAGKGAAYGAGGVLATRGALRLFPLADPFARSLAYEVMTTRHGMTHAEARRELTRKFQDFGNEPPAVKRALESTLGRGLLNEFSRFTYHLLKMAKNQAEDNPARLAVGVAMISPILTALWNHRFAGFSSDEERRIAEDAAPEAFLSRPGKDGKRTAVDLGRLTGSDLYNDVRAVIRDPEDRDAFWRLVTTFGGSMMGTTVAEAAFAAKDPEQKSLRFGYRIRDPQEGGASVFGRRIVEGLSSPFSPVGGSTVNRIRRATENPYQRGRELRPVEVATEVMGGLTGVRARALDLERLRREIQMDFVADDRRADEEYRRQVREANVRTDSRRMARALLERNRAKRVAAERRDDRLDRLTPRAK